MPESNMSMTASDIDKATVIGTLDTAEIAEDDCVPFYDISASGIAKQRKTTLASLCNVIRRILGGLPTASSSDIGKAVVAGSDGTYQLGPVISGEPENFVIEPTDWQPLTDSEPFYYYAEQVATTPISYNSTVELINNNPVNFARYGLAINTVNSQTIQFIACSKPVETVVMRVVIYG